ncbi:MAG: HAMP domain-containing histidine kinase [Bdellovibrionales bacterium]|nr:HAMP domain-containing histidine kinase [Bdellovibrionales bacterium]
MNLLTAKRSWTVRYGAAVLSAGLAVGAIGMVETWKAGTGTVLAFDVAAIAFSALFGGFGPSIVTAIVAALAIDFFFIAPTHALMRSVPGFLDLTVDLLFAAGMSSVIAKLRSLVVELDRMADLRQQMLNVVAHDLRNPLSGIRLNASILGRMGEHPAPERVAKIAAQIEGATGRMDRLIGDLLDTEKIRSGHFRVKAEWGNGEDLVLDAVRTVSVQALNSGVELRTAIAAPAFPIYADNAELMRVICNLLTNAVKFSPRGGVVELRLERAADRACFVVSDEGAGIPEEDLGRLFDRYWQARETAHRGTGLGLFIASAIVRAHGGTIRVESTLGKGSRFFVELPLPAANGVLGNGLRVGNREPAERAEKNVARETQ